MSDEDTRWEELITGLRAGDEEIVGHFYHTYGGLLERLAARNLETRMGRRFGPDDIAQSAIRTFLRRCSGGQFELDSSDSLWNLLCAITLTKVREQVRFHQAQKRALSREATPAPGGDMTSLEPSPSEAAEFAEQFERILASLDEEERAIFCLRLEQRTNHEIADQLGCSERTVRRILARIRERLEVSLGGP